MEKLSEEKPNEMIPTNMLTPEGHAGLPESDLRKAKEALARALEGGRASQ